MISRIGPASLQPITPIKQPFVRPAGDDDAEEGTVDLSLIAQQSGYLRIEAQLDTVLQAQTPAFALSHQLWKNGVEVVIRISEETPDVDAVRMRLVQAALELLTPSQATWVTVRTGTLDRGESIDRTRTFAVVPPLERDRLE